MYFYDATGSALPPAGFQQLEQEPAGQYLAWIAERYALCDGLKRHRPLWIDFGSAYYQARGGIEYLPRAFRGVNEIADATAGWGRDAWLLAYRGFQVTMYERNPYLAFLLQEALRQAESHPVAARLRFSAGDAAEILGQHEAVYLDPMYPAKKKNAKAGLEMQALQYLLQDVDAAEEALLRRALQSGQRVVVKRPKQAPFLGERPANYSIEAPNTRYDVYLSASLPSFRE